MGGEGGGVVRVREEGGNIDLPPPLIFIHTYVYSLIRWMHAPPRRWGRGWRKGRRRGRRPTARQPLRGKSWSWSWGGGGSVCVWYCVFVCDSVYVCGLGGGWDIVCDTSTLFVFLARQTHTHVYKKQRVVINHLREEGGRRHLDTLLYATTENPYARAHTHT